MWEDENCKNGGRWTLRVPKSHTNKYWEDLVLAMLGEQFIAANEINGLVIGLKPQSDTIAIWNKHGKDAAKIQ
jgi:translation initiation factor 4E